MYSKDERDSLLRIARESIRHGLQHDCPLPVTLADYSASLRELRACFVTLTINKQLRGCIGTLEAHRPLVEDVAANAFAAAFRDPRFEQLNEHEYPLLHYHISVLTPPQDFPVKDEADLLAQVRPGIDGLVIAEGHRRGTFLPSVWESLPTPPEFIQHLKMKAGLPANYWSDTIKVQRYTVEDIT